MALYDKIICWYALDGNANDSHGGYHGTEEGGAVSWVAGKVGQAGGFALDALIRLLAVLPKYLFRKTAFMILH
jgi:hypothetical protein